MPGGKKLLGGLLAVGLGSTAMTVPAIIQPSKAQTQNPYQQKLDKLLEQVEQQTIQGYPQQAIATSQQILNLARQLRDKKAEATALIYIGANYSDTGRPQKALEFFNAALQLVNK